jgi:carbon monoxide dehydrogenase subunit G
MRKVHTVPKMPPIQLRYLALACATLMTAQVHAETRTPSKPAVGARQERLDGLSSDELSRLGPELTNGPVALVEFADMQADQLPAINIAVPVHARAELVTRIISDPAAFPRFMPTLDSVKIIAKHDNSIVYDWAFELAVLHMQGRNVMTVYPAPAGKPEAASRITIDSEQGDLGRGRFLFRVHPRGETSLLVLSMRLDLREANYVARQVAKAARSVNRSANVALAFSLALHVRSEAEQRAKYAAPASAPRGLRKPNIEVGRLAPLLNRGDLLFFSTTGAAELDQIAVVGAVAQNQAKVQTVMHDAEAFGSSLVPGSKAEVVSRDATGTTFDWTIALPLVGVSGTMRMEDKPPVMSISATQGALSGGRWLFELTPVGDQATLINGWARFDFSHSTWLLEKLVSADPYLGQGIVGASQLMLMRAIRSRAAR